MGARLLQDHRAGRAAIGASSAFLLDMEKGLRLRAAASEHEERAGCDPANVSSECGHLSFGCFAVERCARIFDRPLEGLPGLADDLFIGGDCALGCHVQRVRLDTHVGREFPLALGGAVIADRTVEILGGASFDALAVASRASVTARE